MHPSKNILSLALFLVGTNQVLADCSSSYTVQNTWGRGQNAAFNFPVPLTSGSAGWTVKVTFDKAPTTLSVWNGKDVQCNGNVCTFTNKGSWDAQKNQGSTFNLGFQTKFVSKPAPLITGISFNDVDVCSSGGTTTSSSTSSTSTPATTTTTTTNTTSPTLSTTTTTTTTTTTPPPTTTTTATTTTSTGTTSGSGSCSNLYRVSNAWNVGASVNLDIPFSSTVTFWNVEMTLSSPITKFEAWVVDDIQISSNGKTVTFKNKSYNGNQGVGSKLTMSFNLGFLESVGLPSIEGIKVGGQDVCNGGEVTTTTTASITTTIGSPGTATTTAVTSSSTASTTTATTTTTSTTTGNDGGTCTNDDYGFKEALKKSLLFYEAQRSGKLPTDNRIPWRKDSALDDGSDVGLDLSGGYYDAGDHVKFGFPLAYTLTVLSWGGIEHKAGYEKAGQWDYLLDAVIWGMDYLIKAHPSPNVLYGQVGTGGPDHSFWGRPEHMTMTRPAYKIDQNNPGSDLAGETAAAFAASSILFQGVDDDYSETLLDHAKDLFNFADTYRGVYSQSISDAATFYNSWSGYNDELAWSAAWLYKATGESFYLQKAQNFYTSSNAGGQREVLSWDNKYTGVQALMAQITKESGYISDVTTSCQEFIEKPRSPLGESWFYQWGSLRYANNAAFICWQASKLTTGETSPNFKDYALSQLNYALGSSGRSFVVGFGTNPPTRPHHRAASCPDTEGCNQYDTGANPNIIYGALVGGPDERNDQYEDNRNNYVESEVALDFNAGYQSLLAGLIEEFC